MPPEAASAPRLVYKPPVEVVDAGARAFRLRQVLLSIAIAALVMLVFGSKALVGWCNGLPIGPVSDFLLYLAQGWHQLMTEAGVTGFAETLRKALRAFEALR